MSSNSHSAHIQLGAASNIHLRDKHEFSTSRDNNHNLILIHMPWFPR